MIGLAFVRLVDAHVGVLHVETEILHMPQDVTLAVLRARRAEMGAQPEEGGRRFGHRPALDRQAAQQQEAAAVQHLVIDACPQLGPERRQREIARRDRGDIGTAGNQRLGRGLDLGHVGGVERHQPVVATGGFRAVPGRGTGLLRRQFERHQASQGKRGANSSSSLSDRR